MRKGVRGDLAIDKAESVRRNREVHRKGICFICFALKSVWKSGVGILRYHNISRSS